MILTEKVNLCSRVNAVSWGSGFQKVVGHQNKLFKSLQRKNELSTFSHQLCETAPL